MKRIVSYLLVVLLLVSQGLTVLATDQPNGVISAGSGSTYAVKKDGSLWAYGNTWQDQIGIETSEEAILNPVKIMDDVRSVVNGVGTTFAIKKDGSLWGWGSNGGNFGNGTKGDSATPIQLLDGVKMVATDDSYTLIIKNDGSLWGTGQVPGSISGLDGSTRYEFMPILVGETFKFIAACSYYSVAIKENGEMWAWGNNDYNALGIGAGHIPQPIKIMDSVASAAIASSNSMVIREDGSLWMSGNGYNGKFYDGKSVVDDETITGYVKIMESVVYAANVGNKWFVIKKDKTLWGWGGDGQFGLFGDHTMTPIKLMDNVSKMSMGDRHLVVVKTDQTLWTGGQNASGGIAGHETAYKTFPFQKDLTDILDSPSPSYVKEIEDAIVNGLIPNEMQSDYTKPITRKEFAKLVVTMVEKKTGMSAEAYITSKGLTLPATSPFTDVTDPYVTAAFTLSIVSGVGNNKYDPNKTINRQEAGKMLTATAKALGYQTEAPLPTFDDIALISDWAKPYIGYMVNIGVMKGSVNKFDPKGTYVRQMAFITMNRIFENLE